LGSIVGGFIASLIWGYDPQAPGFHAGGLVMSTIGAVILLAIYLNANSRGRIGMR